jgi:NAD(P)-dependent dehydrogenase (short-subunit alcohol dehydrogenase family)
VRPESQVVEPRPGTEGTSGGTETYRCGFPKRDVNLTAPLFLIQALADHFSAHGRIVNVSTGDTRLAAPSHPAYAAARSGLNGLGLALAPTPAARGVRICTVIPGVIDTT